MQEGTRESVKFRGEEVPDQPCSKADLANKDNNENLLGFIQIYLYAVGDQCGHFFHRFAAVEIVLRFLPDDGKDRDGTDRVRTGFFQGPGILCRLFFRDVFCCVDSLCGSDPGFSAYNLIIYTADYFLLTVTAFFQLRIQSGIKDFPVYRDVEWIGGLHILSQQKTDELPCTFFVGGIGIDCHSRIGTDPNMASVIK